VSLASGADIDARLFKEHFQRAQKENVEAGMQNKET
jgi:hypothetical protein